MFARFLLAAAAATTFSHAFAATIDFESVPGVTSPTEGLPIDTQFEASFAITFALEGGGTPRLAKIGNPLTAFEGPGGLADTPAPGQGVGSFFLTDDGSVTSLVAPPVIVSYSTPTSEASGAIVDIDFDETFLIQARAFDGSILQAITIRAGDPGTGDGIATLWSFTRPTEDVFSIRFAGTRTVAGGFGLAFDNFNAREASPVPELPQHLLLGIGVGLLAFHRRLHSRA